MRLVVVYVGLSHHDGILVDLFAGVRGCRAPQPPKTGCSVSPCRCIEAGKNGFSGVGGLGVVGHDVVVTGVGMKKRASSGQDGGV